MLFDKTIENAARLECQNENDTPKRFFLLSLGCPKNEVDAEQAITDLCEAGYTYSDTPMGCGYIIVNTCSFIEPARREAIEAILDMAEYKEANLKEGINCFLLVTGCLAQSEPKGIYESLPEVDAILGTADYKEIPELCTKLAQNPDDESIKNYMPGKPGSLRHLRPGRKVSGDRRYAYIKISEGCSNPCAFCAIPGIRGPLRSRPIEDIYDEASILVSRGYKELVLIAQDTTRYGRDLYGANCLTDLIESLSRLEELKWIRMLYVYGDAFSDKLIQMMAENPKLLPYVDIPIQHASNKILKGMRRRETRQSLSDLFFSLKEKVPDLVMRTTVMLGFPGESDEDFAELLSFIEKIRFDRLGTFVFSPEKKTLAARMEPKVDPDIANRRYEKVMEVQKEISKEKNLDRVGKTYEVLIEKPARDGIFWRARSYAESPDVDPVIYVADATGDISPGDFVRVRIESFDDYDLYAVTV